MYPRWFHYNVIDYPIQLGCRYTCSFRVETSRTAGLDEENLKLRCIVGDRDAKYRVNN